MSSGDPSPATPNVPVVGLIGGVGSGKSLLARTLKERLAVEIVDGDVAGHEALRDPVVQQEIRQVFGDGVFDASGNVDRRAMSRLVFGAEPARQSARSALEAIVHPRIARVLEREVALARNRPGVVAVVVDAAVLLEAGWKKFCDAVLFVDAPIRQREERVRTTRGWSARDLESREQSQLPLDRKRREADDVVDNSRTVDEAVAQLEQIIRRIARSGRS